MEEEKFYRHHVWDHVNALQAAVGKKFGVEVANRIRSFVKRATLELPSEKDLRGAIGTPPDQDIEELLKDYTHYREHRSLHRKESLKEE